MDFRYPVRGLPHPLVNLKDFRLQGEGLAGDAFVRQAAAEDSGRRVISCFQRRADRRYEHRRPPQDIDCDDRKWAVTGSLIDEGADIDLEPAPSLCRDTQEWAED